MPCLEFWRILTGAFTEVGEVSEKFQQRQRLSQGQLLNIPFLAHTKKNSHVQRMSTLTLGSFLYHFILFSNMTRFPAFSLALQSCTDAMRSWTPWCQCSRVHRGPCYRVGWIVVDLPGDVGTLHSYLTEVANPTSRRNVKQNGFGVNIYLSFLGDLWWNFAGRTWIWPRKSWSR